MKQARKKPAAAKPVITVFRSMPRSGINRYWYYSEGCRFTMSEPLALHFAKRGECRIVTVSNDSNRK